MDKNELYLQYQRAVSDLASFVSDEGSTQDDIAKKERGEVAEAENEYMQITSELQEAMQTITAQYKSVRESCASHAGLRRPEAVRPSFTNESWREAVKIQEQAAQRIREWIDEKVRQAKTEKMRKLQLEQERKAALALSAAEAERKRKEKAKAEEEARGASLLEEMKQKYRGKYY